MVSERQQDRTSIVILTGAGISADSGVATFRGSDGLWEGHRVEEGLVPGLRRTLCLGGTDGGGGTLPGLRHRRPGSS
jgi:hypothetical protein